MCGIAGIVDYKKTIDKEDKSFREMLDTMHHRGPDDEGMFFRKNVCLLHKRLSVIDPRLSSQPMTKEENGTVYTIVYNGELYNTEEIKSALLCQGYSFTTNGDTEVVLTAYIAYGEKCLDLFNGIFAFALWDNSASSLFFARDAMGVKPFFYHNSPFFFAFASTVPTLLAHSAIPHTIDDISISEMLLLGPGRSKGNAIFSEIKELPPGFCGTFSKNGLSIKQYFRLQDKPHPHSFNETLSHVKYLVRDAILRQTVSDVPLGTFLSGGLDSSLISAIVAQSYEEAGKTLDTFSVTYKNHSQYFKSSHFQPDSDEKYIEIMVNRIKSNHHEVILDTDTVISSLYDVIDEKGLPAMADVDSSLLAFCKEIKKHVTVALSGESADEIFGGYPWYRDKDIRDSYGFPWAQNTSYRMEFLNPAIKDRISSDYVNKCYCEALSEVSLADGLSPTEKRMREMFVLNIDHFMQTLLFRKDSCSMHASLEVRVPFCDRRICEYMYSVPWEYKNYQNREKGLLRYAFSDTLPDEILWRKKSPYPKTHNPEYLSALREIFSAILKDKDNPLWDILNIEKAKTLLAEEKSQPWYGQLMTTPQTIAYFIQIEYWLRKFSVRSV
ncbi:MAG: asparagine synthase (glutamine-hydrolyzing) [Clostridia bacterium]|nr:asparagine synthase (glutamine-hydrolyzing) [Clostridia bacterium]